MKITWWAVCCWGLFIGCREEEKPLSTPLQQKQQIEDFIARKGWASESIGRDPDDTVGFFYYMTFDDATSLPDNSNIISFYYTLKNLEGTIIDFHTEGSPLLAQRGTSSIYPPGFDEGLKLMTAGDRYVFLFPSHQAYGDLEISPDLPANSIVCLEVEIVREESPAQFQLAERNSINNFLTTYDLDNDPDTIYRDLSGLSVIFPNTDSTALQVPAGVDVTINWAGSFLDGTPFMSDEGGNGFEFVTGAGQVIEGLDLGVQKARVGVDVVLVIPSDMAYGASVQAIPVTIKDLLVEKEIIPDYGAKIPPFTTLLMNVSVRGFE